MESLSTLIGKRAIGVVGIGKWGRHLVHTLQSHTSHPILQSDHLRAATEPEFPHISLSELTEHSDILFLSAPLTAIREILEHIRTQLREGQTIIDIASSKRSFMDVLSKLDREGGPLIGSIHPMSEAPPRIPSLRGQNGIVCEGSERSREAEAIGEALFQDQQMIVHRIRLEDHDRMMDQIQGNPHFLLAGSCAAMSGNLGGVPIGALERIGSPNFQLFLTALGRGAILDPSLQADLITSMAASPDGVLALEQTIAKLQKILRLARKDVSRPPSERELPAFIAQARNTLDPTGHWREHMREQTNAIIVRLANIRAKSMHLTAREDRIGLLKQICEILERHGIDLNAIDSLPSKKFPQGMEFELGRKDKASLDIPQLMQDLSTIDVLLAEAETQQ
ncbi:MAG: prephenate dehydrogenase/arogenate dehydrogenase family protein [Candidatus Peribacter sp.]|jgi:prephenate dehydrogenase